MPAYQALDDFPTVADIEASVSSYVSKFLFDTMEQGKTPREDMV
jgi:hypothetical protein